MKNALWIVVVGVVIVLAGAVVFITSGSDSVTGNVVANTGGDVQKITLSERNLNYFPQTITVKADQPVELTLDSSVKGCLRAFTIRDLGVNQYVRTASEVIKFTPTKKGTFTFACSMGMGYGTIIVE